MLQDKSKKIAVVALIFALIALSTSEITNQYYNSSYYNNTSVNNGNHCNTTTTMSTVNTTYENFDNMLVFPNAINNLSFITVDGSGQVNHPDIYYNPSGWSGYKYWLVATPYNNSNASLENPSIWASNDGNNWFVPNGLSNPIAPPPQGASGSIHNNDPDIFLNTSSGNLTVIYGSVNGTYNWLNITESHNGVNWTSPRTILNSTVQSSISNRVSYSYITFNSIQYVLYIDIIPNSGKGTFNYSVFDGTSIFNDTIITDNISSSLYRWHMNAITDNNKIKVMVSIGTGATCSGCRIRYAETSNISSLDFISYQILDAGSAGAWDVTYPYRVTMLNQSGNWKIWYSGRGIGNNWSIGYTSFNNWVPYYNYNEYSLGRIQPISTNTFDCGSTYSLKVVGGSPSGKFYYNHTGIYNTSIWYYDNMTSTTSYMALLRINDATSYNSVGVWTGKNTTNYVTATGTAYTNTSVVRSLGWVEFAIVNNGSSITEYINRVQVGQYSTLGNITKISVETNNDGVAIFDNLYLSTDSLLPISIQQTDLTTFGLTQNITVQKNLTTTTTLEFKNGILVSVNIP